MAGRHNITVEQGSTFYLNFTVSTDSVLWNLTSYTARMQARANVEAEDTLISLTTGGGGIVLGGAAGTVAVTITAAQSAAIPAGSWVYDFELVSAGGEVTRLLEGKFRVTAEVTR